VDPEVQHVDGELYIVVERLAGIGFDVNMPVDDQEDLELRVRAATRAARGDDGSRIDITASVQVCPSHACYTQH